MVLIAEAILSVTYWHSIYLAQLILSNILFPTKIYGATAAIFKTKDSAHSNSVCAHLLKSQLKPFWCPIQNNFVISYSFGYEDAIPVKSSRY